MTTEQIQAMRDTIAAATPGPWMRNGKAAIGWRLDSINEGTVGLGYLMNPAAIVPKEEDADFVALARTELPKLLDDVERLQRENQDLQRLVDLAAAGAERDGLEYAELRRVVAAARLWRHGGPDRLPKDSSSEVALSDAVEKLSPTAAKGLAMEKARARVVKAAQEADRVRTAILARQHADGPQAALREFQEVHGAAQRELAASVHALEALEAAAR